MMNTWVTGEGTNPGGGRGSASNDGGRCDSYLPHCHTQRKGHLNLSHVKFCLKDCKYVDFNSLASKISLILTIS